MNQDQSLRHYCFVSRPYSSPFTIILPFDALLDRAIDSAFKKTLHKINILQNELQNKYITIFLATCNILRGPYTFPHLYIRQINMNFEF